MPIQIKSKRSRKKEVEITKPHGVLCQLDSEQCVALLLTPGGPSPYAALPVLGQPWHSKIEYKRAYERPGVKAKSGESN
ncbi:MAG: hypothetical protein GC154_00820 [bacterium]|nr:hypothetical protein [bacterium]